MGYGMVGYSCGKVVFEENGALGEHVESYDTEMMGLKMAADHIRCTLEDSNITPKPSCIVLYADNTGALNQVFQGKPSKGQELMREFRKTMCKVFTDMKIALHWCPGHLSILGNGCADQLAKQGAHLRPVRPNFKSLSYIARLCKKEMAEEWNLRWMNTLNPPKSGFHTANQLAPKIKPTRRFSTLDRRAFSRTTQFHTGHTHIGEYYHRFSIASESKSCSCGKLTQTRAHILSKCPCISRYRHNLGRSNQPNSTPSWAR
jgi:ribonuclease HI